MRGGTRSRFPGPAHSIRDREVANPKPPLPEPRISREKTPPEYRIYTTAKGHGGSRDRWVGTGFITGRISVQEFVTFVKRTLLFLQDHSEPRRNFLLDLHRDTTQNAREHQPYHREEGPRSLLIRRHCAPCEAAPISYCEFCSAKRPRVFEERDCRPPRPFHRLYVEVR